MTPLIPLIVATLLGFAMVATSAASGQGDAKPSAEDLKVHVMLSKQKISNLDKELSCSIELENTTMKDVILETHLRSLGGSIKITIFNDKGKEVHTYDYGETISPSLEPTRFVVEAKSRLKVATLDALEALPKEKRQPGTYSLEVSFAYTGAIKILAKREKLVIVP